MKKILILMIVAVMLTASAVGMTACANGDIYDDLAKEGYTVKVTFDAGEAVVNETQNVTIVEVFDANDIVTTQSGKTGIKLLAPDDERRGDAKFKVAMTDGENNYFSPGWYTSRSPRVDENGKPLDSYGVPVEVSGREQGYVYSGKWDFENDVVDPKTLENGEMTLYAAWIPFISYEIYVQNDKGEFELSTSVFKIDFSIPEWNERSGKLSMGDVPKVKGKTFSAAYADAELTREYTESIDGDALFYDFEKGIANVTAVKVYTTWLEGEWIKIFDAEQLIDELEDDLEDNVDDGLGNKITGNYILGADLDFTDVDWPEELLASEFAGQLKGEGYAINNVVLAVVGEADSFESLFASVSDESSVSDVTVGSAD